MADGEEMKGKKRRSTPQKWKRNQIKQARVSGLEFTDASGNVLPARTQTELDCVCRCAEKFTEEERQAVIRQFNELADHDKQNIYLRGCIRSKAEDTIRRRVSTTSTRGERKSFQYCVCVNNNSSIIVCQKVFLALHGVKRSRLRKKVLDFETDVKDAMGKHGKQARLPDDYRDLIREHISTYPARESHYSRTQNKLRKYLDSNLCVSELFRQFLEKHPELKDKVRDWVYRDIFLYEFNISFGYPRSDICDTCEGFQTNIAKARVEKNVSLVQKLQMEHELHKAKGDSFAVQMKDMKAFATENDNVAVICMDFQKNFMLPVTNIGQEYYKRQLAVHNFCVHDLVTDNATMFVYPENFAHKGPNDVLSMLDYFIDTLPPSKTRLVIFCDNCFSQNKNKFLIAYLHNLSFCRFREINVFYPLPGHSRMACDRDFGRIEKKKRRTDKFLKPSDLTSLVRSASLTSSWTIVNLEHPFTDDLQPDDTPVVRVRDFKSALEPVIKAPNQITGLRGISFFSRGKIMARDTMNGVLNIELSVLKRGRSITSLDKAIRCAAHAYTDFIPVKPAKHSDIQSLLQHAYLDSSVSFYSSVRGSDAVVEEVEVDECE